MNTVLVVYSAQLQKSKQHFVFALEECFRQAEYEVINSESLQEAAEICILNPRVAAVLYDWDDFGFENLHRFSNQNKKLPVFAMTNQHASVDINLNDFDMTLGFLQYDANLVQEDFNRVMLAIENYRLAVLPPFTQALMHYVDELNYVFCTPGHLGGTAFQKTPTGAAFYDFFGANIFKADVSISIAELGSLLDHSGPHRDAEKFIAETFGSDRSLIVTNGTSTANKMVGMYSATAGDTVVIDRNCHKSLAHFLMMVDVIPIYLKPTRNAQGILGGIPITELTEASLKEKIAAHPHAKKWPTYAAVTNSTYDGIFYHVETIQQALRVKHLHFDSAWVPYTKFHPIYAGKFGLSLEPESGQVIFETQSTHKLLAAFSQASVIHVKGSYNEQVLNENYMMHTSTSPFYPIVASCEISAAMMQGEQGTHLINEAIELAMDFRKEIKRLREQSAVWYFDVWQPDEITVAECFALKSGDGWHGFKEIDNEHLYLDPIKVTVISPGIKQDKLESWGIPASIVEKYLATHGIIVEKTGPYTMLFLFSVGVTKAKAMTLLAALNRFKQLYDQNELVKKVLPALYAKHPEFYAGKRIQEIAQKIHSLMKKHDLPRAMYHAFDQLPEIVLTPHQAYQRLVRQQIKRVPLRQLQDEVSAVMILPYPPGVPLVMPGERITTACKFILEFLLMLVDIGQVLPGFETDIHGIEMDETEQYCVQVLTGEV